MLRRSLLRQASATCNKLSHFYVARAYYQPGLVTRIRENSAGDGVPSYAIPLHSRSLNDFLAFEWDAHEKMRLNNFRMAYSSSSKVEHLEEVNASSDQSGTTDSENAKLVPHEETIFNDGISEVAKELKESQKEMIINMRKCSRVMFAAGAVHVLWGGMMFCALDEPLNHAVMTEVCLSSIVILGLAYQMKQTMKPVELYANYQEYRLPGILFLSRQVSRMVGAFFHRGAGIGFVLSLTLTAQTLSCLQFFY